MDSAAGVGSATGVGSAAGVGAAAGVDAAAAGVATLRRAVAGAAALLLGAEAARA